MSRIYDVSLPIFAGMVKWPDNPDITIEAARSIARGDSANVSDVHLGSHTGTHVDAPVHFIPGARGVDQIPVDLLVGPARVLGLEEVERVITADQLAQAAGPTPAPRLLFKTRNSRQWAAGATVFDRDYVHLDLSAADWLVQHKVRVAGTDYLSIEGYKVPGAPVHHRLLEAGLLIIEGLNLSRVPPGDYELVCGPLKIRDGDGAPARVLLIAASA
jgi:arylformamidase